MNTLTSIFVLSFLTLSCRTGIQGGDLAEAFAGADSATALSPTAIKLEWKKSSRYGSFKIYRKGNNEPIATENFSYSVISSLTPSTTYEFAVTAIDSTTNQEIGLDSFVSAKTLDTFQGIQQDGVTVQSPTRIDLTWAEADPSVTFQIYKKIKTASWDFTAPIATLKGVNSYVVSDLTGGTDYCFFVVANYLDGTSEPAIDDIPAVDTAAPCAVTEPSLENLPVVTVKKVVPGAYPWFLVSGGDPAYTVDIHEKGSGLRVASRIGNGAVRTFTEVAEGKKEFYAIVKSSTGGQATYDVTVSGGATKASIRYPVSVRANFPTLQNNGRGIQQLGEEVVSGDFNCDGLQDIAASAITATTYVNTQHYEQTGAVIVYYTYDEPPFFDPGSGSVVDPDPVLITDPPPSETAVYPNPQLIYYPVSASNVRFGTHLAVGNVNGDCSRKGGYAQNGSCDDLYLDSYNLGDPYTNIKQCQDLAVSTQRGEVYVIFGDPLSGLVSGSGGANYGINEFTCDATSNSCRAVRITSLSPIYSFGKSIAFGDFNNDGFDDLAIGAGADASSSEVRIYRGSDQGLYPENNSNSFAKITASGLSVGLELDTDPIGDSDDFAEAVQAIPNSRVCKTDGTYTFDRSAGLPPEDFGYDFTKCDDLVIGLPGRSSDRGSILACKGVPPTTGDLGRIVSWDCRESYPNELDGLDARYGQSLLGVANQNGYPVENLVGTPPPTPDLTGALFVGAPYVDVGGESRAGKIYGYYVTPEADDFQDGGLLGILGPAFGHDVVAQNSIPCNAQNNNVTTGTLKHCYHQGIYNSPPQAGAQFGWSLSTLEDLENTDRGLPALAVGAPYQDVLDSSGTRNIANAGVIFVYKPDTSSFGFDSGIQVTQTQASTDKSSSCTTLCTWYSGGISPYGPSLVYPLDLNASANFGFGGAAGGNFNGGAPTGDIVASARGSDINVTNNGELFVFYSGGSLPSSVNRADMELSPNVSKELNYRYERAKIVGDINGDGYDDVMTHIIMGSFTRLILFYGSAGGLITSPEPSTTPIGLSPLLVNIIEDPSAGTRFYGVGSVNGDAYDDILILGSRAAYMFHGSFAGLVAGSAPEISPVGTTPLKFARSGPSEEFIDFTMGMYGSSTGVAYDSTNQSVGHGDFNADGYSDIAIGIDQSTVLPATLDTTGLDYAGTNRGRVVVFYGSADGLQVDRTDGYIRYTTDLGDPDDVVAKDPCTPATPSVCKIQLLSTPTGDGDDFGFAVEGMTSLESISGEFFDELLVGDPGAAAGDGRVLFFKGTPTGLASTPLQTLVPHPSYPGRGFGFSISSTGDINGDSDFDIAITAPNHSLGVIYVFYGGVVDSQPAFVGESTIGAGDFWVDPLNTLNSPHTADYTPRPQVIRPATINSDDGFGLGLSAAGDFDMDGFMDVAVNVPSGDYDVEITQIETGYALIFFGGPRGLRISGVPNVTPRCIAGSAPSCEPYMLYLPDREEHETMYLSQNASGDVNGDGMTDLIFGSFGRQHPSGQAYSVGVFYVVY